MYNTTTWIASWKRPLFTTWYISSTLPSNANAMMWSHFTSYMMILPLYGQVSQTVAKALFWRATLEHDEPNTAQVYIVQAVLDVNTSSDWVRLVVK